MRRLMLSRASAFKPPSLFYTILAAAVLLFSAAATRAEEAPSVGILKQALDLRLHKNLRGGVKTRTVQFQQVRAGKSKDGIYFPFEVSGVIHDIDAADAGGLTKRVLLEWTNCLSLCQRTLMTNGKPT